MTQSLLSFESPESVSFTERVARYFKARSGVWIDGLELAKVGGVYAYRTRISDCRTELGMQILNRVRRLPGSRVRVSEYKFVAKTEAQA